MEEKPRFVLIDANSIVHRAYHAYPITLSTSEGEIVNAVYGFTTILFQIVEKLKPSYLICAFDVDRPTFRHKMYTDYKANRKPIDKELASQFPRIKEILKAFEIPILEVEGYEADDVIGTLEKEEKMRRFEKVIVTGDQDIFQLVDDDTKVYLSGRNFKDSRIFGIKDVERKMGLSPSQIIDFKSLYGDPSDNIPGVKGVGKKGAVDLISKYGGMDGVYKHLEEINTRYKNKLIEYKKEAYLSKDLARINSKVPLKYNVENCRWDGWDKDDVRNILERLEFRSLLKKINSKVKEKRDILKREQIDKNNINVIKSKEEIKKLISRIKDEKKFVYELELENKKDIRKMEILKLLITLDGVEIFCIDADLIQDKGKLNFLGGLIKEVFEGKDILKIGYDIKSSIHALRHIEVDVKYDVFDIEIAAYVIQGGKGGVKFSDIVFNYCDKVIDNQIELKECSGKKLDDINIEKIKAIFKVYIILRDKIKIVAKESRILKCENWDIKKLIYGIEMPLIRILAKMEEHGILVDKEYLKSFNEKISEEIVQIENEVYKCVGHEFNISSPKQVSEILFQELDLPKKRKTKSGNYSTRSSVLVDLEGVHPVVELILKYREITKLQSTYTSALLKCIDEETGRIHSSFNQAVTVTGRLSSSDPNLQNIPIASELGKKIRTAFIPEKKFNLVSLDISQQELRILAHLSGEEDLKRAFKEDVDVHLLTAAKLFDKEIDDVTKKERRIGKTINYGIMYGMSPHGLASSLKISFDEASEFIGEYFQQFRKIKEFFVVYINKVRSNGFAETLFGRRRYFYGLKSSNSFLQKSIEREARNFPIQGTAADMIKLSMIDINKFMEAEYKDKVKMLLQVHDELVFECSESIDLDKFTDDVKNIMKNVYPLDVPIKVDVYVGKNLGEIH